MSVPRSEFGAEELRRARGHDLDAIGETAADDRAISRMTSYLDARRL
jgi:hypothetical protein